MSKGILLALGVTILFQWTPASGPVAGYEVVVGNVYVGSVSGPLAYLDFGFAPVMVRAFDAEGRTGPWSEPSAPIGIPDFGKLRDAYPR